MEDDPTDEAIHQARINGKRARYATELLEDELGKPGAKLVAAAKEFQDAAGEHHDAVVAEARIRALLRGVRAQRTALAAGILVSRQRDRRNSGRGGAPEGVAPLRGGGREGVGLSRVVRAAGGVVWRRSPDGLEVLLIHRPRYGDWSFPKGKAKGDAESDEDTAVREVEEEVGLRLALGPELESTGYRDSKGRRKVVRYWAMELPFGEEPIAGDGVDEVAWSSRSRMAAGRLTWDRDLAVLDSLPVEELV